jgi:hypothetical protein
MHIVKSQKTEQPTQDIVGCLFLTNIPHCREVLLLFIQYNLNEITPQCKINQFWMAVLLQVTQDFQFELYNFL